MTLTRETTIPRSLGAGIRVAILDLNNNVANQGMRCITELVAGHHERHQTAPLVFDIFDVRHKTEIPNAQDYDIFISSGGPDSPFVGEGEKWEQNYFDLLDQITTHNRQTGAHIRKKYLFCICYSFQLMARYFELGKINERNSVSFGITAVRKTFAGNNDPLLNALPEKFFAADFRNFQLVQPDMQVFEKLHAKIVCKEKIRPYVPYERCVMGVRISDEIFGTQFHPEADRDGMIKHFSHPEREKMIREKHGAVKYKQIITRLDDPSKIDLTHKTILPNFIQIALQKLDQTTPALF